MPNQSAAELSDYYNLGNYQRSVTTNVEEAQTWFNRGLVWCYAFNHQAASDCFEEALARDPDCSMGYWGLAYALGPNYNKPWELFDAIELQKNLKRAHWAATQARSTSVLLTDVEIAMANAILQRYPKDGVNPESKIWSHAFADAMGDVYNRFPEDLDVLAVYVDALMNLTPWQLWDLKTGQPAPQARTLDIQNLLERALAEQPAATLQHPGLLHLYIHLVGMSATPEQGMNVANHLRGLGPDAGHLHHMPTHLDVLCGDYKKAIASDSDAIKADEKFLRQAGSMNFYSLYRAHDYHFRLYAAMFAEQSAIVLSTIEQLKASIPEELLRIESPPMADWLEGFAAMRVHPLIRFGKWNDIINLPLPSDPQLYYVSTAMYLYAKGIAYAVTGSVDDAERMCKRFLAAVQMVKPSRTVFNSTCLDLLKIAAEMLDGELNYRLANYEKAFQHLRKSIEIDDVLPYDELWSWMQLLRYAYGALLLEQGHVEEAIKHHNNVWSLHGYHECLQRLGHTAEANLVEEQLRMAKDIADINIESSCFCRRVKSNGK